METSGRMRSDIRVHNIKGHLKESGRRKERFAHCLSVPRDLVEMSGTPGCTGTTKKDQLTFKA